MNEALSPLPELQPGIYRHFKGGEYELVGVARCSETLQALVVYRPLYGTGELWVRPWEMFTEQIMLDGVRQPRFAALAVNTEKP